ncbi:MAG: argininosuccinate lyase [Aggregatilineales bacterium]
MADSPKSFPHPLYEKYVLLPFFEDALVYYHQPMLAANKAHTIMLYKSGIIVKANAKALLSALNTIGKMDKVDFKYQSGIEDLFFVIERKIIDMIGAEYGGNIQLGRSRNDLGYALTRMALRPLQLDAMKQLLDLRQTILKFARQHLQTIMPGYTHTQPAQPTTMAHYMAGVLSFLERDTKRLQFAYETNNQSPLGAAALTGTGFPVDRDLSAELLGFDGVMPSTYDSIAASDNLTDVANALSSLGTNLSRFTHDMLFWATQESGAIRLDDSFIQISSIMPQKRNPVVLEHLRARISRMLAQSQGIITQSHSIPYGDTQDIEDEIFPMLFGSLETSAEILDLYGAVMETLHVNVEHLSQRATAGFTTVTELADTLVRKANLPFRQAHSIVSGMVTYALTNKLSPEDLTSELLTHIAQDKIGLEVHLSEEDLQDALNPVAFINKRTGFGGSSPTATAGVLDLLEVQLTVDKTTYEGLLSDLDSASEKLKSEVENVLRD